MNFQWPWLLLLLLILPLFIAAYLAILRKRRRYTVNFSSLSLLRDVVPKRNRWRRHAPFVLMLLGLCSLIIASARPAAAVQVPLSRTSIILALDVSLSMCSNDVEPNRLTVAKDAALAFIEDQADGTQIGLVAFAGIAEIIVPPTSDKDLLREAVTGLTASLGTAIGSATMKSIDAIAEVNESVAPSQVDLSNVIQPEPQNDELYVPDIIVLLTDGANSQGPPPLFASQLAADRRIRVYTIGFGTENPMELLCTQEQLGTDVFEAFGSGFASGSGGGFGGRFGGRDLRRFLVIDESTLQSVSGMTGGEYFRAESAEQLVEVFLNLPTQIVLQTQNLEISVIFAALGALLAVAAVFLSQRWSPLP